MVFPDFHQFVFSSPIFLRSRGLPGQEPRSLAQLPVGKLGQALAPKVAQPGQGQSPPLCLPQPIYPASGWPRLSDLRAPPRTWLVEVEWESAGRCHWLGPPMVLGEAGLVSVVHKRPQQEAMVSKSSTGKVGTLYLTNPSHRLAAHWIWTGHKKAIGLSLRFLAAVWC